MSSSDKISDECKEAMAARETAERKLQICEDRTDQVREALAEASRLHAQMGDIIVGIHKTLNGDDKQT